MSNLTCSDRIVFNCDEDSYFIELVRYIHLNPLLTGLVKILSELERILGSGDFVHGILSDSEAYDRPMLSAKERQLRIKETIKKECQGSGIDKKELNSGGRRAVIAEARADIANKLVGKYGLPLAEVARNVGVFNIINIKDNEPKVQASKLS